MPNYMNFILNLIESSRYITSQSNKINIYLFKWRMGPKGSKVDSKPAGESRMKQSKQSKPSRVKGISWFMYS